MTATPIPQPEVTPAPHVVVASEGTRLEQLHAQFEEAKAAKDEAEKRFKAVTDGIKAELSTAEPGQGKVELRSPVGPPLRMTYVEAMRFDSKRLKADAVAAAQRGDQSLALLYATYATQTGSWQLRAVSGSDAE